MKRGELWWEVLEPTAGAGGSGHRPVVVSSADWWNNEKPPVVAIVPISSSICSSDKATENNITLPAGMGGLSNRGSLLPEQLRFVDCRRLTSPMGGELSGEIMDRLQDILLRSL